MHKIFAKTLFLGKNLIFLPHCHSTNEEAKRLAKSGSLSEGSIIYTDYQEKGRGQQGNVWLSEPGKNLLFTTFLKPENLLPTDQFRLNLIFSIALAETLQKLLPEKTIEIKWPNDIYCDDKKVAGILIETVINQGRIEEVFCGIGLNVNQSHFSLLTATSLLIESGNSLDRDEVLENLLLEVEKYLEGVSLSSQNIQEKYLSRLRWLNQSRIYKVDEVEMEGEILGISPTGRLIVKLGNDQRSFDVKEIQFIR